MSDSYQAIYDAVRSRISGGNIGEVVSEAARQAFDISWQKEHLQQAIYTVAADMTRPSVLYRPTLSADGTSWCALLGDNLQEGVAGFGDTPAAAMSAFDAAFLNERTSKAIAMEARRAETAQTDSVADDSAGPQDIAQPSPANRDSKHG